MPRYDCKPLPEITTKDMAKFWALVDVKSGDECWLYRGWRSDHGYGMFVACGRNLRTHRLAYYLVEGIDPYPLLLCHKCDIRYVLGDLTYRLCCNPDHLFIGSHAQNSQDMAEKGRSTIGDRNPSRLYPERVARGDRHNSRLHPELTCHGERNGNAKLTSDDVKQIRELAAQGIAKKDLAIRFGVGQQQIYRIVHRERWARD